MLETAIEVKDFYKRYGSFTAIDGISFTVRRGKYSACSARTGPVRLLP